MKHPRRPNVSLVTETGMFLSMSSSLISGGPLLPAVFDSSSSLPPLVSGF